MCTPFIDPRHRPATCPYCLTSTLAIWRLIWHTCNATLDFVGRPKCLRNRCFFTRRIFLAFLEQDCPVDFFPGEERRPRGGHFVPAPDPHEEERQGRFLHVLLHGGHHAEERAPTGANVHRSRGHGRSHDVSVPLTARLPERAAEAPRQHPARLRLPLRAVQGRARPEQEQQLLAQSPE